MLAKNETVSGKNRSTVNSSGSNSTEVAKKLDDEADTFLKQQRDNPYIGFYLSVDIEQNECKDVLPDQNERQAYLQFVSDEEQKLNQRIKTSKQTSASTPRASLADRMKKLKNGHNLFGTKTPLQTSSNQPSEEQPLLTTTATMLNQENDVTADVDLQSHCCCWMQ